MVVLFRCCVLRTVPSAIGLYLLCVGTMLRTLSWFHPFRCVSPRHRSGSGTTAQKAVLAAPLNARGIQGYGQGLAKSQIQSPCGSFLSTSAVHGRRGQRAGCAARWNLLLVVWGRSPEESLVVLPWATRHPGPACAVITRSGGRLVRGQALRQPWQVRLNPRNTVTSSES